MSSPRLMRKVRFGRLYHDGYSRPNKPVNELVSLEIIKHLLGLSDEQLEHAYLFDFRVRNALGRKRSVTTSVQKRSPISADAYWNTKKRLVKTCCTRFSRITEATSKTNLRSMPVPSEWIRRLSRLTSSNSLESISSPKSFTTSWTISPTRSSRNSPAGLDEFADTENLELSYESRAR